MKTSSFSKCAAVAAMLLALPGCMKRVLEVRSEPEGAAVYVNGEEAGTTPLDHPFTFYGTVEVTLRAPGYLSHRQLVDLPVPWYQFFPLDLVSDLLPIRHSEAVDVELVPAPAEVDPRVRREIQAEAQALREILEPAPVGG